MLILMSMLVIRREGLSPTPSLSPTPPLPSPTPSLPPSPPLPPSFNQNVSGILLREMDGWASLKKKLFVAPSSKLSLMACILKKGKNQL